MADKRCRSLIKALSWRFTASLDTLIISLLVTRKLEWALTISCVEICTKITLYYFHERIWNRFPFGKGG